MHVFSKRSFLCRHIAGIGSIFLTGFLPGICSKFLSGFLPKFLVQIPGRIPARNLVQIPGRIPANLNISLQIPQGVHTDSCRNLYKKNLIVKGIPARNLVSFSCGNTAVFLLDNFVRETLWLHDKKHRKRGTRSYTRRRVPQNIKDTEESFVVQKTSVLFFQLMWI